ncbi:MAG: DapH/DapD/GlmU-related protein, partial [Nitrospirae bacterium]|nr:DapH/DapD/GlmU-related protein [Nitrospirota bacterium]
KKHVTIVEDDVFIGSDSQLIAPVKIGKGAYVGAGSTITNDVPSLALGMGRTRQINIKDWVLRKKLKVKKERSKRA